MRLVKTGALILASPDRIWTVLTDFNRFAEWSP